MWPQLRSSDDVSTGRKAGHCLHLGLQRLKSSGDLSGVQSEQTPAPHLHSARGLQHHCQHLQLWRHLRPVLSTHSLGYEAPATPLIVALTSSPPTDLVSGVQITAPSQLTGNSELPAGIQLLFASAVTTHYNTTLTGDLQYIWNIASQALGTSFTPPGTPSISFTFPQPGAYTVTLSVVHLISGYTTDHRDVSVLGRQDRSKLEYMSPRPCMSPALRCACML